MALPSLMDRIDACERMAWTTRPGEALALATDCVNEAVATGLPGETGRALRVLAWCCLFNGDNMRAVEMAAAARRVSRGLGDDIEAARASVALAQAMALIGMVDEALSEAFAAETAAAQAGADDVRLLALNARGCVLANGSQFAEAIALFEQFEREGDGSALFQAMAANNLSHTHREVQQATADRSSHSLTLALDAGLRAVEMARTAQFSWGLRCALDNTAQALVALGRFDEAEWLLAEFAAVPGAPLLPLELAHGLTRGELAFRRGEPRQARDILLGVLDRAAGASDIEMVTGTSERLAEILAELGQFAPALEAHRLFHEAHVAMAGREARWRARVAEILVEADRLRAEARQLADDAGRDPLTGLANRRRLDELRPQIEAAPYAVAIFDLDHFKRVNDGFSHAVGDAVLKRIAILARDTLPADILSFRLGGEEFLLLAPHRTERAMAAACEELRAALVTHDWSSIATGLAVTASFGVAAGEAGHPLAQIMAEADTGLYEAKAAGRNRVVTAAWLASPRQPVSPRPRSARAG